MTPNPGTREATAAGCTCAAMDNHYGRGYMGQAGVFVYTENCPLHRIHLVKKLTEGDIRD